MRLEDIFKGIDTIEKTGDMKVEITGITHDSREVKKGYLFVALKGFHSDGHDFIQKAIDLGASALLVEDKIETSDASVMRVQDTRKTMAFAASAFYSHPSSKFELVGITGTNGKTTTSYLMKSIFEKCGRRVGLVGTIGNIIDGEFIPTTHTTPESPKLQETFSMMNERKVDTCVMEVSSHSLDLGRVLSSNFDIGVFTNLTPEHMDFHKDLDSYFEAKSKLFFMTKKNLVNMDDQYGKKLCKILDEKGIDYLTYGFSSQADIYASEIVNKIEGASFKLNTPKGSIEIGLHAPGRFNVYNALAACGTAFLMGISLDDMAQGIESIPGVRGRFEVFRCNKREFSVIIDYAHSPDGYHNLFDTVNEFKTGKSTVIFGCGGDRDATKRPVMGEIAASKNDLVILTTDNPRSEDPEKIIKDIIPGIERAGGKYEYIVDRKEAIEHAINTAQKDDIILIIGKGHESYQLIHGVKHPFNEKEIIEAAIARIDG